MKLNHPVRGAAVIGGLAAVLAAGVAFNNIQNAEAQTPHVDPSPPARTDQAPQQRLRSDIQAALDAADRAQQATRKAEGTLETTAVSEGVNARLKSVFAIMQQLVGQGGNLVVNLKQTLAQKPADTKGMIDQAAGTLGAMADFAGPTSDLGKTIEEIRNTALAHKKAVTEMPPGMMTEKGRTRVLNSWGNVITGCEKAESSLNDIHDHTLTVLKELRMRETEVTELMMADQYLAALNTVTTWVNDLDATVKQLHNIINGATST